MSQMDAQRRYFEEQAASYDYYTAAGAWTANLVLADALAELSSGGATVRTTLDLGTGTGQSLEIVHAAFPAAELWASDLSPAMMAQARQKVPSAHFEVSDLSSHVASLTRSFDLITAIGCLELIPDLLQVLPALLRHVTAGGHLALTFEPAVRGFAGQPAGNSIADATEEDDERRTHYCWSTAEVLGALCGSEAGGELIASELFEAYERAETPVLYELLLIQRT